MSQDFLVSDRVESLPSKILGTVSSVSVDGAICIIWDAMLPPSDFAARLVINSACTDVAVKPVGAA